MLGQRPNQLERLRDDVTTQAADLLDAPATPGEITEAGVRANVSVGSATSRRGCKAWSGRDRQSHGGRGYRRDLALADLAVDPPRPRRAIRRRADHPRGHGGAAGRGGGRDAREVFEKVALHEAFVDFLTMTAYAQLIRNEADVGRDEGRRHRACARGGDRVGRDPARQHAPPGAPLRAVRGEPHAGARGAARLAALGLVTFEPNRGVRVRMLSRTRSARPSWCAPSSRASRPSSRHRR